MLQEQESVSGVTVTRCCRTCWFFFSYHNMCAFFPVMTLHLMMVRIHHFIITAQVIVTKNITCYAVV